MVMVIEAHDEGGDEKDSDRARRKIIEEEEEQEKQRRIPSLSNHSMLNPGTAR